MSSLQAWTATAAEGIEALAVVLTVGLILIETARWLSRCAKGLEHAYPRYRAMLGKTLLIGLELLVAADIIRTVGVELTLLNIGPLGGLVLLRTSLGWALTVEIEGRWPWQPDKAAASAQGS
jgi:uncharacterized membrane protein